MLKEVQSISHLDQELATLVRSAQAYVGAKYEGGNASKLWNKMHSKAKTILETFSDMDGLEEKIREQLKDTLDAVTIDSFFKHLEPN